MGKADYLQSFKQYADRFICTLLPGASHPQIQYSPGLVITIFFYFFFAFLFHLFCYNWICFQTSLNRWAYLQDRRKQHAACHILILPTSCILQLHKPLQPAPSMWQDLCYSRSAQTNSETPGMLLMVYQINDQRFKKCPKSKEQKQLTLDKQNKTINFLNPGLTRRTHD